MPISTISASHLNEDNDTKIKRTQLSPNDFMTLMLAQLRMQDPLKPYDNAAMLQNMAQISSLNATKDLQDTIKTMNTNMGKTQVLSASQLVGKDVALPSDMSALVDGKGLNGSVIVPGAASQVTVSIKDANNQEVRSLALGSAGPGSLDFNWDGTDSFGQKMAAGIYHFSASASVDGKPTAMQTAGIFKVKSVGFNPKSEEVVINVDGLGATKMNDILKIL